MKIPLLLSLLLCGSSFAAPETWTSKDGKSAQLELVSVMTIAGEKIGQFKTQAGKTVSLSESQLSEADATRLKEWKAGESSNASTTGKPAPAAAAGPASVYDKILDKDLVRLSGKSLKRCEDATKPTKYYVFYYSASWCHPCHQFTPSVVEFYNKHKANNDQFEMVLITRDTDESAMTGYAKEMGMPWPILNLKKAPKFDKEFNYNVDSIPRLVLTDLQGTVLANGQADVMSKLDGLLK
jgi:nucleoredoxin